MIVIFKHLSIHRGKGGDINVAESGGVEPWDTATNTYAVNGQEETMFNSEYIFDAKRSKMFAHTATNLH